MIAGRPAMALIFTEDFDRPPVVPPPAPAVAEPVFSAADMAEARAAGWAEGHRAGTVEAESATAALTHDALITIAERLDTARSEAASLADAAARAIAELITSAFAAAFPALCARYGDAEIIAVADAILPRLREEPAVTIHAAPAAAARIEPAIMRSGNGMSDRILIVPDGAMAAGDLRVIWRAGRLTRDTAALWREIEAVLAPAGLLPSAVPIPHRIKETEHVE